MTEYPELTHNLAPRAFMWLWAKYVTGFNPKYHCTQAIKGNYSKVLSAHNEDLVRSPTLHLNEQPADAYAALYVCGVARAGYSSKKNYPHNLHTAIRPKFGASDEFVFENWRLCVKNGVFLPIPPIDEIPSEFSRLEDRFTTCRIFRWAVVAKPTATELHVIGQK